MLRALIAWREKAAETEATSPTSLLTLSNLERLAEDRPDSVAGLEPGRHGSGLVLARHGESIVEVVRAATSSEVNAVPSLSVDEDTRRVVNAVTSRRNLYDLARVVKLTPAATAQKIQKALEAGLDIERGDLIPESVYLEVVDYLRQNRYAKLRHVREQLSADVDLPTLRVAMAFARQEFSGIA